MPTTVNVNGAGYSLDVGGATGSITTGMFNKVTLTTPATGSTLTIVNGKTLTASNTLAFAGTDGSTLNIGTGGTLAALAYVASVGSALGYTAANDANVLHTTGNETKSGNLTLTNLSAVQGIFSQNITATPGPVGEASIFTGSATIVSLTRTGLVSIGLGEVSGTSFCVRNNGDSSTMLAIHATTKKATLPGAVEHGIGSGSADPTSSNFASGYGGWWKNTTANEVRFWYNDAGTLKKSAALT